MHVARGVKTMVIARLLSHLTSGESVLGEAEIIVILLGVTLIVALTSRRLRLPYTLLLVLVGLVIGILPVFIEVHLDPNIVLFLFLPALLFEGAWNVEIEHLVADWLPVLLLAVPGLVLSLTLVAVVMHWGIGLPWLLALLLGAMVSPTDPVAVISLLRQLGMADRLRTIVEGESLFNDGLGAAAFQIILLLLLTSLGQSATTTDTSALTTILNALWLMFGGLALGLAVGWIFALFLRLVDERLIEITVTFCVAYGVYILGEIIHTSGLLAVVGAGLVMGSYGRRTGMSEYTRVGADAVWEFIAYLANSFLFLLVGIEIGETHFTNSFPSILWALVGVIVGRVLMIYMLIPLHDLVARRLEDRAHRKQKTQRFLPLPNSIPSTWRPLLVLSGLRGALSIALVLSLPTILSQRNLLIDTVFGVVLVTLLGQGLGLRILLPRWPEEETSS
ncbi:MAG TPA: sodium:proton antiporter [Ktedonobacteraceae bacterium]